MTTTGFTESVSGWGWDSVQAMLGGALVRIAGPVLQGFHSDLYRDFQAIAASPEGDMNLVYVVREAGTHLYDGDESQRAVELAEGMSGWHSTWHIVLRQNERRGDWVLEATPTRVAEGVDA